MTYVQAVEEYQKLRGKSTEDMTDKELMTLLRACTVIERAYSAEWN